MSMDRRQFLKYSGIASILGFGASVADATNLVTGKQLLPPQVDVNREKLSAKRWAMVVDMSKFKSNEDFQRTITACHSIHNVPDFRKPDGSVDKKFEIKWIWKSTYEKSFPGMEEAKYQGEQIKDMPFLLLCNHCTNPACVRVCPTKATYKLPDGITMQDMHRCIGCRFCMAACPYGSRSFNWIDPRKAPNLDTAKGGKLNNEYPCRTKGVVEKCTFCTERLAVGKVPACVEAAPKGALLFGDLEDPNSEVRKVVTNKLTIRRKPELGMGPAVFYLIGGGEHA